MNQHKNSNWLWHWNHLIFFSFHIKFVWWINSWMDLDNVGLGMLWRLMRVQWNLSIWIWVCSLWKSKFVLAAQMSTLGRLLCCQGGMNGQHWQLFLRVGKVATFISYWRILKKLWEILALSHYQCKPNFIF